MKSFYILAAALAILLFVNDASAQYVAVRSGNWNDDGINSVWIPGAKPPAVCNSCTITINSGATVTLNTSVTLTGNSLITIGSGGSNAAMLVIPAATAQTDFASGNNIIMANDGSNPGSQIVLGNILSSLNASGAGTYDGVLVSLAVLPIVYVKQIGTAPDLFTANLAVGFSPAQHGTSLAGPITLTIGTILPILLTDFTAQLEKSQVKLDWTTALESNSDHFSIQRLDLTTSTWETIGKVAAQGNSSTSVDYTFTDENPHAGVNNYRLQSVDRDGKTSNSEIKAVTLGSIEAKIFPNPASDFVNVNVSGAGIQTVRLFNQSGQLLVEKKVDNAPGTVVSLPVTNYPQGNYVIIVTGADGSRQVSKLFISRL